jgi:transcriptional regulator with XRE-family HTH domain
MASGKKQEKTPARPLSTPEDAVARGIREARRRRGWTQQNLADRLAAIGYPLDRSTLAKLETTKKARGISLNDALAIAAALGIAPVHLLTGLGDEAIALGEKLSAPAWHVRAWIRGRTGPLPGAPGEPEEEFRAYYETVPPREKELLNLQIYNDVELLSFHVMEALDWKAEPTGKPDQLVEAIKNTADDIHRNARRFVRDLERSTDTTAKTQDIRP